MSERYRPNIEEFLQDEEVQERIQHDMERGRSEATVTIGRAASLFGFTENQLRDWEDRGLLKPLRPPGGQRQYSLTELDKLAIIRELINARYAPGEIPSHIGDIWNVVSHLNERQGRMLEISGYETEHQSIDRRVELADQRLFWRNYIPRVLRLSLMLICNDVPDTIAGLVLPLQRGSPPVPVSRPEELPKVCESLVGWIGQNRSFSTFLDQAPEFEYPTDFRVLPLQTGEEDAPKDSTLIVVQRKTKLSALPGPVVETIRLLLAPLYEDVQDWKSYFGQGMRDSLDPATDFSSGTNPSDSILNGLADMVVRVGGQMTNGQPRWRFCSILLPDEATLPLQHRSLVVRAQSKDGPHKVGVSTVHPHEAVISLSLRAFQGGHIIYRPEIAAEDSTIAHREVEGPIRSAVAVPVGGENGMSLAVLYVASDESNAFSPADQRVLRIIGRIVEEMLLTYRARQQVAMKLEDIMTKPSVVDASFGEFGSETEFVKDVEELLTDIKTKGCVQEKRDTRHGSELSSEEVVSFIAIDIDNQTSLATKYGDQMTRNLSREVGLRIQGHFRALIRKTDTCRLYHAYADRFYLMMKGVPLEQARGDAERLRNLLKASYKLDAQRVFIEQPTLPGGKLTLSDVTVRLVVTSYKYTKLTEILQRYPDASAVAQVRAKITGTLDDVLKTGMDMGGNIVISWDNEQRRFMPLPPSEAIRDEEYLTP